MKLIGPIALCMALATSAQALVAGPPSGAGLAGTKAYVDWIYRSLPNAPTDHVRYAPALRRWMDRDAAYSARRSEVGALDGIPFCGCQDFDAGYRFETHVVATATGATARVRLHNGTRSLMKIDLVPSRRGWLVSDVHSKDTPSLLALLRREVPREEKDK